MEWLRIKYPMQMNLTRNKQLGQRVLALLFFI